MRRLLPLCLTLTICSILTAPAAANLVRYTDPDDTEGILDIKVAGAGHETRSNSHLITHWVKTYEDWDSAVLGQDSNDMRLRFNTDSDPNNERVLRIAPNEDGSLYAEMSASGGQIVGYARVWRPDQRTVKVAFPKRLLRKGLTRYTWDTDTRYSNASEPECPGQQGDQYRYCADTVFGRHRLS